MFSAVLNKGRKEKARIARARRSIFPEAVGIRLTPPAYLGIRKGK